MRRHSLYAATALAAGGVLVIAAAAVAQEQRDVIVVIGQTIEETLPLELERYGSDLETISSEEIRNALYQDASSAMQMETPGLFLTPTAGPFSYFDVSFQGSRTQDMLFLVDGVRINNRLYPGTTTDTLPASMIERIEVLKGGQSLFYGTNAAAGVINVVTRGYTGGLDGMITVGADTNEGYDADGYVRGQAGPGNYVLYAGYSEAEGFQMFRNAQPSAFDKDRGHEVLTYGAKYRLELTPDFSIDARYQHNDADLDFLRYSRTFYSQNSRDEEIASLGLDWSATDTLSFLVKGYWHDWDTRYTEILNDMTAPYSDGRVTVSDNLFWGFEDKGVNALAKFTPGGPFEYLAGYDFQQYSALDEVWRIEDTQEDVHAVFGQIRTTDDLIENGAFALGVRYNETGGASGTVWNLSGRYDFTPNLYVQGVAGASFLLPNAEQLYVIEVDWYLGNPDVEPEESENLNLAIGGQFESGGAFSWQVTYFARDIKNLIDGLDFGPDFEAITGIDRSQPYRGLDISGSDYSGVFWNVDGAVEVRGAELLGTAAFDNGLSFSASYTHSESEIEGTGLQLARVPKDYAKIGAVYDAGRWGAGANVLWTGEQEANAGSFGRVNYGDYAVLDLNAHLFIDRNERQKLAVRLENAFDEDYVTRVAAGVADDGGGLILIGNCGAPQTVHVSYSYRF
jgi:vitamin B12 transporter